MFDLRPQLEDLRENRLYRQRRVVEDWSPDSGGTVARVDGVERTVFCGNDYLGLAHHPRVTESFQKAAARYGVGSGASHLVTGHSREHHALEEALAHFTGRKRALLFSTGYMANLGIASALLGRGDVVLEDRLNHASLLDAGLLSGARFSRYAHADTDSLTAQLDSLMGDLRSTGKFLLARSEEDVAGAAAGPEGASRSIAAARRALVMTDGVFSMDGDVAPLATLAEISRRHKAWLMVDDAHGIGVLGERGRGTLEALGLDSRQVPVLMGTLGKALGTFGAFVAGDDALIELLIQKSRTYIYTTALPPAVAAATLTALELIDTESWRRGRLFRNIGHFRTAMEALQLPLTDSRTPIQPVMLGSAARALEVSEGLWERGFWVAAIRPPTVPDNTARLRVTLSAAHTTQQIDALAQALSEVLAPT